MLAAPCAECTIDPSDADGHRPEPDRRDDPQAVDRAPDRRPAGARGPHGQDRLLRPRPAGVRGQQPAPRPARRGDGRGRSHHRGGLQPRLGADAHRPPALRRGPGPRGRDGPPGGRHRGGASGAARRAVAVRAGGRGRRVRGAHECHPARVHGQPVDPPSALRRHPRDEERRAGDEGPRQPRPRRGAGRGAALPVRAPRPLGGGARARRPGSAARHDQAAGVGRQRPQLPAASRGVRAARGRGAARARRGDAGGAARAADRDRHVPALGAPEPAGSVAARRHPPRGPAGAPALGAARPRVLAEAREDGAARRAGASARREDGALPRAARGCRRGRRDPHRHRRDPGPGLRGAAPGAWRARDGDRRDGAEAPCRRRGRRRPARHPRTAIGSRGRVHAGGAAARDAALRRAGARDTAARRARGGYADASAGERRTGRSSHRAAAPARPAASRVAPTTRCEPPLRARALSRAAPRSSTC